MSYLNTPRMTFSGRFQADVSTVNNDPTHFDNANFKPEFQQFQTADAQNGWWNPDGTGNWRLIGCTIQSVTYRDGTSTTDPSKDPIIGMSLTDTDLRTAAKLVDLDPQQQMVSQIWGLVVRIVTNEGTNIVKGDYDVAPFMNIWFNRSVDMSADGGAGAAYQSVLKNVEWEENYVKSRYINELREVLEENNSDELSIQFNVDRYIGDNTSPEFTLGRMTGSIGPAFTDEPKQFVAGRQLFPHGTSTLNYAAAIVDESSKSLVIDMGNALQAGALGAVHESRNLHLAVDTSENDKTSYVEIGKIDYAAPNWYLGTSGICSFPLTDDQIELVQSHPLVMLKKVTEQVDSLTSKIRTTVAPVMVESLDYVRAEQPVFRLNPCDLCTFEFYATHMGKPLPNAEIHIQDITKDSFGPTPPAVGEPALPFLKQFPNQTAVLKTDQNGKASIQFEVADPGNPREYIDGQVYALSYNLSTQDFSKDCNDSNFLSLLIFSGKPTNIDVPTWDNFIQPVMQQYANLYPLMSKGLFNLADKNVFDKNAQILKLVFSKDPEDPNYMPATRDLSAYKQKVILEYLDSVIANKDNEIV